MVGSSPQGVEQSLWNASLLKSISAAGLVARAAGSPPVRHQQPLCIQIMKSIICVNGLRLTKFDGNRSHTTLSLNNVCYI